MKKTINVRAWNGMAFQVVVPAADAARRAMEIATEVDGIAYVAGGAE